MHTPVGRLCKNFVQPEHLHTGQRMGLFSSTWLLATALSLPHLLYMFIWLRPSIWRKQFRRPVDVFATTALVLKCAFGTSYLKSPP